MPPRDVCVSTRVLKRLGSKWLESLYGASVRVPAQPTLATVWPQTTLCSQCWRAMMYSPESGSTTHHHHRALRPKRLGPKLARSLRALLTLRFAHFTLLSPFDSLAPTRSHRALVPFRLPPFHPLPPLCPQPNDYPTGSWHG